MAIRSVPEGEADMKIGDKVKILRELHPDGYSPHIHFGKLATVLCDGGCEFMVSIDSFPNMNHRELRNRFVYHKDELEVQP